MESCFQDRACSVSSFRTNNTYRKDWLSPNKEGKCRLSTLRTWSFLAITTVLGGKNLFTFIDETVSLRLSRVRAQSRPTLCNPMDCSPSGSSVHGILQARILGWVASSSSRGSSWFRDWTRVSGISCIAGGFFIHWAIWEDQRVQMPKQKKKISLDLSETQHNNYILKYFLKCSVAIESEPSFP